MADTSRPNFFILLELDPTKSWSDEAFQKALKEKKIEWTKKTNDSRPKINLQAKQYLKMIPLIENIINDEKARESERTEAIKQKSQTEKEVKKKFYDEFKLITARGYISKIEITTLSKKYSLSEAEICYELTKQEIPIREEDLELIQQKLIDESTLKQIRGQLDILGKSNLYDFLDLNCKASSSELLKVATNKNNENQKVANKTSEVTAISALTGQALKIFKTEEMRDAYDQTLQEEVYEFLKEQINTLAQSADKTIYAEQFKILLSNAYTKGLDPEKSKDFIKKQARNRKLAIEVPEVESIKNKIVCINCETINDRKQDSCSNCMSRLKIECPSCGQVSTVENRACSKCYFPIGNQAIVRKYLSDTKLLLIDQFYDEAIAYLNLAKEAWQNNSSQTLNDSLTQEIERDLKEAQQKQQQKVERQNSILNAINERRFYEAHTLLQQSDLEGINIALEDERKRIKTSIQQAEAELAKARTVERSGQDPIELYQNVLWICQDCKPAKEALAKTPPSPASDLVAHVGNKMVSLSWKNSSSKNVNYTIVRKYNSRPVSSSDEEQLATISGTAYDDTKLAVGLPVFYAVYTNREGVMATSAAQAQMPVMVVGDVTNVVARTTDGQINLSWQPPDNVSEIEVYRDTQRLSNPKNSERVESLDKTQVVDRNLENGKKYYYTIYCLFKDITGKLISSDGVSIEAVPEEPPTRINELKIEVISTAPTRELKISWKPSKKGDVAILLSIRPGLNSEDVIPQGALAKYGKLLMGTREEVKVTLQDRGVVYLTPVVLLQQSAYIGKTIEYANVDDVTNLKVQKQKTELQIRWDWPRDSEKVIISYSHQEFPSSFKDNSAVHIEVTKAQYNLRGHYLLKSTSEKDYFIVVHAVLRKEGQEFVASGLSHSARTHVSLSSLIVLKYQIVRKRALFGKGKPILTIEATGSGQLPELVLVRKIGGIPLKKTDGEVALTIPVTQLNLNNKALTYELEVQNRSFGKLFLVDDKLYESMGGYIRINHPASNEMEIS